MNDELPVPNADLAQKIARLVEERGWNADYFARAAGLNRQTARHILVPDGDRRLRNATVSACARALGLSVSELRTLPLEKLLPRMNGPRPEEDVSLRRLYDRATQPELLGWIERNPERAAALSGDEMDELLSVQGTGGHLTAFGVEHYVELIERKRRLLHQIHAVAGTEYLELMEKFVQLLYDKVQPYRDRA